MTAIGVPVTCPTCGQPVDRIITQAAPSIAGTRAVIACATGHQWLLNLSLTRGDGR
jgi:hypothetical protein